MKKHNGLTASPSINGLLEQYNQNLTLQGKPAVTSKTLEKGEKKGKSKLSHSKKVPMVGLVHLSAGRGVSDSEIRRRYNEQRPSFIVMIPSYLKALTSMLVHKF